MSRRAAALGVALAALALAAAGAHAAALGDNTVKLKPSLLKLPQNIGPLRYSGGNRYSDRRLGRSFGYNASGISLNIYVYDFGLRALPDGPDSVAACEQYESAKREIEQGGNYENIRLRAEVSRPMRPSAGSPLTREAEYEFDRNGVHAISVLWLTAADGFFLKVRLSLRAEIADELDEARRQILAALSAAIAAQPAKPAAVAVALTQDANIEVDAGADPADAALWLAYAVELSRFSREHPETRPPCGGLLSPGFAAELSARHAALREYAARGAGIRSGYFDLLARLDAAGLLDEYVWHYLRDPQRDFTAPPGTELAAFESIREHELATHVAQSGAHVRINAVRVLPLAAAP